MMDAGRIGCPVWLVPDVPTQIAGLTAPENSAKKLTVVAIEADPRPGQSRSIFQQFRLLQIYGLEKF